MTKILNTNFDIRAPKPIDKRTYVASESDLNGIPIKYNRMKVYAIAEDTEWRYFIEDLITPWHEIVYTVDGGESSTPGVITKSISFIATAAQTIFQLLTTPVAAWVWINGAVQDVTTWSIVDNTIVVDTALTAGDLVEVYYFENAANVVELVDKDILDITGGTTVNASSTGEIIAKLTTVSSFVLPLLSSLTKYDFTVNLKNISGDVITVTCSGGDLMDDQSSMSLSNYDNLRLYVSSSGYLIL